MAPTKLYAGNLPPETDEKEVRDLFSSFGRVDEVAVLTRNEAKFAFIHFQDGKDAQAALDALDQADLHGYVMSVQISRSKGSAFQGHGSSHPPGFRGPPPNSYRRDRPSRPEPRREYREEYRDRVKPYSLAPPKSGRGYPRDHGVHYEERQRYQESRRGHHDERRGHHEERRGHREEAHGYQDFRRDSHRERRGYPEGRDHQEERRGYRRDSSKSFDSVPRYDKRSYEDSYSDNSEDRYTSYKSTREPREPSRHHKHASYREDFREPRRHHR